MSNLGALDMALDDVISQNRTNKRQSNSSSARRGNTRGGINKNRSSGSRSSPYNGARPSRNNIGARNNRSSNNNASSSRPNNSLVVSNLHFNVTEKDLYDLFGQIGQLKRAFLHIGPNGKSAGIADIIFQSGHDAEKARNTYNNVELDGRPMRINNASIISAVSSAPSNNNNSGRRGNLRGGNNSNRRDNNNGGGRGGRGRRETRPKPSEQDLDAEMDSYMNVGNEDIQMN